jgi:hypothetical protein
LTYILNITYITIDRDAPGVGSGVPLGRQEVVMLENKSKVLLILSQEVVDQARIVAGKATVTLKLPVSLQIVLRALIEDGLKRDDRPTLLANVESQAKAVRRLRSMARQGGRAEGEPGDRQSGIWQRPNGREQPKRRKSGGVGGHPVTRRAGATGLDVRQT